MNSDSNLGKKMLDWIEAQEFPIRAVLAEQPRRDFGNLVVLKLDESSLDWVSTQEFPIRPILYAHGTQRSDNEWRTQRPLSVVASLNKPSSLVLTLSSTSIRWCFKR